MFKTLDSQKSQIFNEVLNWLSGAYKMCIKSLIANVVFLV